MSDVLVRVKVQQFGEDPVEVEVFVGSTVGAAVEQAGYRPEGGELRRDNVPVSQEATIEDDSVVTLVPPMHGG